MSKINTLILIAGTLLISSAASAQEYGLLVGVHQTTATTDTMGATTEGVLNFKAGLVMAFELVPNMRFKTGVLYNQRHVDLKLSVPTAQTYKINFDFIDVPANVQYNFNEMFGVFGGLVVGINVGDDVKVPAGTTAYNADTKSLIPLVDVGVNFMFADMIGFDVYYERGLGDSAKDFGKYSTFGGNFIYWF